MSSLQSQVVPFDDDFSRRALLRTGVLALGGLTLTDLFRQEAKSAAAGRAKHCIFVFLNGGQSQLDTFDMKPEAPDGIRGPYQPIDTRVPGMPRLDAGKTRYHEIRGHSH